MGFSIEGCDVDGYEIGSFKKLKRARKRALKVGKKALRAAAPVLGLAANLVPGLGQVASAAILTAAAADRRKQAKKKARRAEAADAASGGTADGSSDQMMTAGGGGGMLLGEGGARLTLDRGDSGPAAADRMAEAQAFQTATDGSSGGGGGGFAGPSGVQRSSVRGLPGWVLPAAGVGLLGLLLMRR